MYGALPDGAKQPEQVIRQELAPLMIGAQASPTLFLKAPYLLDFLDPHADTFGVISRKRHANIDNRVEKRSDSLRIDVIQNITLIISVLDNEIDQHTRTPTISMNDDDCHIQRCKDNNA